MGMLQDRKLSNFYFSFLGGILNLSQCIIFLIFCPSFRNKKQTFSNVRTIV